MGVDTYIFDEVSKECFYFDRNYNWFTFEPDNKRAYDVMNRASLKEHVTSEDVILVCDINIEFWSKDGCDKHRVYWNERIKEFASERPDGSFFFVNDHMEPDSHSFTKKYGGEYTEIGGDA
jgi:hypothetical protein